MVVRQDHGCRIVGQRLLDHLTGMDAGAIDGAAKQLRKSDHPIAIVQVNTAENLVSQVAQAHSQEFAGGARIGQHRPDGHQLLVVPARQLQCGL